MSRSCLTFLPPWKLNDSGLAHTGSCAHARHACLSATFVAPPPMELRQAAAIRLRNRHEHSYGHNSCVASPFPRDEVRKNAQSPEVWVCSWWAILVLSPGCAANPRPGGRAKRTKLHRLVKTRFVVWVVMKQCFGNRTVICAVDETTARQGATDSCRQWAGDGDHIHHRLDIGKMPLKISLAQVSGIGDVSTKNQPCYC